MLSSEKVVTLGEVCHFVGGGTPARDHPEFYSGDIPWATVKDFKNSTITDTQEHITQEAVDRSASNIVESGTVLLVTRVGLGKVAMAGRRLAINQDVKGLTPRADVLPEYLFWFLVSVAPKIERIGVGATVKGVTLQDIKSIRMPLPSKIDQRCIVDLLSRAENIVQMRREAERKAKEIIPALFLDMFGDPGRNPRGWAMESIAEVVAIESPLRTPNLVTEANEVCIGPDSIESMTGHLLSQPTVGNVRPISGKYRYRCRDVLYSKIRPALVKVALAPSDGYCSADMYPLRCGPQLQPEYLTQILMSQHFTRYALERATRAQMPKINREALFTYRLPLPPTDLQQSFARHCQGHENIRKLQRTALGISEQQFQSLMSGVFVE